MVHLRCYHTRIEDAESSYSVSRLKDMIGDTDHDLVAIDKLRTAIRIRLSALDKIEFFEIVKISQQRDYTHNSRIVFYVAKELYAKNNGQEIYVSSTDNKRFFWKEKKDAFSYAWQLGQQYGIQIRDLTKKKEKGGEKIDT